MNFIRTFAHDKKLGPSGILALDFTKIEMIFHRATEEKVNLDIYLTSGAVVSLDAQSRLDFWEVFEEYARAMQSLERGPVSMVPKVPIVYNKPPITNDLLSKSHEKRD